MTTTLEPAALRCLERTRSAVLNVLVAVGVGIAASGFFLAGATAGRSTRRPTWPGSWCGRTGWTCSSWS